jgi:hypothetical protein
MYNLQNLRNSPDVIFRSGTSSSFCISFFALAERKKRNTDTIASTMLPQAKRRLRAALRKSCNLRCAIYSRFNVEQPIHYAGSPSALN